MKKLMILLLMVSFLPAAALALEDGIYRDKAAGYGGDVIVTVIVREGKMTELTTENTGGEKSEYYLKAEEALAKTIIEKQGIDGVDAVAGATGTSESILTAMKGILEQAEYTGTPLGGGNRIVENTADGVEITITDKDYDTLVPPEGR